MTDLAEAANQYSYDWVGNDDLAPPDHAESHGGRAVSPCRAAACDTLQRWAV
jgi:hypothetical protein